MRADWMDNPGAYDNEIHELRVQCKQCRDQLRDLARIHLEIDAPTRRIQPAEPELVGRMRKVCLHVKAIVGWEIGPEVEHVLAPEVRAAYHQMEAIWKLVPLSIRLEDMDGEWSSEARNGTLAIYDHPTPQSLILPTGRGGFRDGDTALVLIQLIVWLGQLVVGYGLALVYLGQILGAEGDLTSRVAAALNMGSEERM